MAAVNWTVIKTISIKGETIDWPWKVALETLRDTTHLQIEATGDWVAVGNQLKPFPPDGHVGLPIQSDRLILSECPVGALIGKIGGSSASFPQVTPAPVIPAPVTPAPATGENKPFAIGSHCLVMLPTGSIGPLFIRFNWMPRPLTINTLVITISGAAPA